MNHFLFILSLFLVFQSGCGSAQNERTDTSTGRILDFVGTLDFVTHDDQVISRISIALADDENTRSLGLMDVRNMNQDQGMLFMFPNEVRQSFWMANTPLALDLIFVNENLEIVSIHHNANPFSTRSIDSDYPAKYVVEVNAGYSVRHDLQVGNRILYHIND